MEKVKNATANGIRKILDRTGLKKIHDKFLRMKGKILKTLQLSPKMLESLNERLNPAGCGAILNAKTEFQTLRDVIGEGGDTTEYFVKCHYWIQSPPGTRIEVKLESLTHGFAVDGCTYEGIEIKANHDHKLTGYRFCAPEDAGMVLRSQGSNLVPIITYTRTARTETVLQYRYLNH
ncbi:hypothetical protein ANCCEY_13818 [Ancylostoma ceylanicum]|uniref:CUB domain-containing protein n=1 Tax=Ancylostoma ceylanicum TaxID=53326 RepID=A0A0D6L6N0_9BILA|nr:hypothetical protein ANCCEY_13818 [Ancylostoma ceylanicum]